MPLTDFNLEHYRTEGFAVGGSLLNDDELCRLRTEIDMLFENLPEDMRPENVPSVHYENEYFRDLFLSKELVNVAEHILGPNVALFTSYIICKRPGVGLAVDWHQDAAFFPIDPMEVFTLWLAVDDADAENGCLSVIPGSHRQRSVLIHNCDLESGTTLPLSVDGIDLSRAQDVELRAGEFSAHDAFILHGSNPNRSLRRRCGLTLKYIPTNVRIDCGWVSPSKFDWKELRLYLARGTPGEHHYAN